MNDEPKVERRDYSEFVNKVLGSDAWQNCYPCQVHPLEVLTIEIARLRAELDERDRRIAQVQQDSIERHDAAMKALAEARAGEAALAKLGGKLRLSAGFFTHEIREMVRPANPDLAALLPDTLVWELMVFHNERQIKAWDAFTNSRPEATKRAEAVKAVNVARMNQLLDGDIGSLLDSVDALRTAFGMED